MAHQDVRAEQAHVDHAYRRLEAMRASATAMLQEAFGERGSTFQSFTERDIRVRHSLSRLEHLQIGREPLVFGRIDRRQDPSDSYEAFHIGRLAVSDEHQEPLVVDWRAPIAEPFYRATGARPMGLARRRHLQADGPVVVDLEDELFDVEGSDEGIGLGLAGPQVLLSALERTRTGRMRDIVATVQREQDEVIRGSMSGILVVQGGPGTGKTAVALHRAAYLLYTYRFPLERQGVLVVGPNPTFLRYIEHVLPSLGESGVVLSTISGLVPDITATGIDTREVHRLKGDPRLARVIRRAVGDRERALRRRVEVPYGSRVLRLSPVASAQIVTAARRRPGTHNARRRTVEALLWRHFAGQLESRPAPPATHALTLFDDESTGDGSAGGNGGGAHFPTPAELGRDLRRRPEVVELLERMWPRLTADQLLHDLFGARPLLELAARGTLTAGEADLLYRPRSADPATVPWTPADVPLLDEARILLGAPSRRAELDEEGPRTFGHIVVDEAQDLSPMQLRMLGRRSLGGSMTVVGDMAQATGSWAPASWAEIVAHLPNERGWREVELTVNYRTPQEIMQLAGRVLAVAAPGMTVPDAVRASGHPPRAVASPAGDGAPGVAAAVARIAGEELAARRGTVGVVVPPDLLVVAAAALEAEGLTFGRVGRGALDSDLTLLGMDDAKGLEFDSVIVADPDAMADASPRGYRAVYVAMTRATQRLTVVHPEPVPALFADLAVDATTARD